MSRLILHIGTHKTATTHVQNTLAAHRRALAQQGVIYPRLPGQQGRITGHHGLAADWTQLPQVYHLRDGALASWQKLAAHFGQSDQTVLLSSEEFSRGDPAARMDFDALRDVISAFDEVEVLALLRDQVSFLQSVYLEISKLGAPDPPGVFVDQALKTGYASGLWLDYGALYTHLRGTFDADQIRFLDYETTRQSPGGILGAVLARADVSADLVQTDEGQANVSPPALANWAANLVSVPSVAQDTLIAVAAEALAQCLPGSGGTLFSRSEVARIKAWAAPANAVLRDRLGARAPALSLCDPEGAHREDVPPAFWVTLARKLARADTRLCA